MLPIGQEIEMAENTVTIRIFSPFDYHLSYIYYYNTDETISKLPYTSQ